MADGIRQVSQPSPQPQPAGAGKALAWHEMTDPAGVLRPHWNTLGARIAALHPDQRTTLAEAAERMIEDLGSTFNVFADVGASDQPYMLDPLPLVIPPAEWAKVSTGLKQRIRLLEAVLADVYGPQTLLAEGLIPPDLVHSSPVFRHYTCGVQPPGGRMLCTTGCDLMRGPSGNWMVLRDHTEAPGGLGQVYENRNVTATLLDDSFEEMKVGRLRDFLRMERESLQSFSTSRGAPVNAGFLTPGFRHSSYFEHAYKARLLGIPLVEPADLTVRERRVYLKTLSGLRRLDGIVCRIDPAGIDPLEGWGHGGEGVPGLIEAWRSGNVGLANAPGSGFASSPALMPFLPRICREWLGEEMLLPFVETWWLGQEEVREMVAAEFHRFILMPASGEPMPLLPVRCASLSPASRKQWLSLIQARPQDFVVQAEIPASEAPVIEGRLLKSRPVVWRAFTLQTDHGAEVLPGGMARVGKRPAQPQLWPTHAGFTKDVWITGMEEVSRAEVSRPKTDHDPTAPPPEVPSRIAEQMFWVGRNAERIEFATRMLRTMLRAQAGEVGKQVSSPLAACIELMNGSGLLPDGVVLHPAGIDDTIAALIHDPATPAGIPALTRSLLLNAAPARDRLSDDTWRLFNQLEAIARPVTPAVGTASLIRTLDSLVLHLAAFSGMQAENMTRGHGWRFLETGRRIERALGCLALLRTAVSRGGDGPNPLLDPLLEICDSVMTYRRRHYSRPMPGPVTELLFADPTNPRSIAFQIHVLYKECAKYPGHDDHGLMPEIRRRIHEMEYRFGDPTRPDAAELEAFVELLEGFSDLLTQHFFSHSVRRVY